MDPELLRRRLAEARVGRLATVDVAGDPHVVPVCFVLDGDAVYWAVDHKPKATPRLRRLANIEAHPVAELVIDNYAEDWTELWWIRVSTDAEVLRPVPRRSVRWTCWRPSTSSTGSGGPGGRPGGAAGLAGQPL